MASGSFTEVRADIIRVQPDGVAKGHATSEVKINTGRGRASGGESSSVNVVSVVDLVLIDVEHGVLQIGDEDRVGGVLLIGNYSRSVHQVITGAPVLRTNPGRG
jgi:hypothetical protein